VRIFSLLLPWFWVGASAWVLLSAAPRARRQAAVKAFGLVLAAFGASCFFLVPTGDSPWWVVVWQVACAAAAWGIVAYLLANATDRARPD